MSKQHIQQVFDAYKSAVFAKDVEAFISLYDKNIRIFDMWEKWSYDGIEAWRGMVAGWFGSLGNELVKVEFSDMEFTATNDMAIVHTFVTFTGLAADGTELRSMQNRLTYALKNTNGTWKIIHEHSSSPLEPETLKAILKRQ